MKTTLQHPAANHLTYNTGNPGLAVTGLWHKFITWANGQESNRFLWVAISLLGHGTFFTIATMMAVVLTGNVFALLVATIFSMAMVLVVNLAAMPTKYTIPVLFLSLLADMTIIITAISLWLK